MKRLGTALPLLLLLLLSTPVPGSSEPAVFTLKPYFRVVTLNGLTHPRRELTITTEVSGRCLGFPVEVGETVPKSGELIRLDDTFVQLDLEANTLARDTARLELEQQRRMLARYTVLKEQQSTPEATYDEVALRVDLLQLELRRLENRERRLREQLERHVLHAPPGWQVIERLIEEGEFIQAGSAAARLGDFRTLLVRFALSYQELQALQAMSSIQLLLPDIDRLVEAEIYQISPVFDARTRKIPVELVITDAAGGIPLLRGGMRVELELESPAPTESFVVPEAALIGSYEAHWLVKPDGSRVPVILLGRGKEPGELLVAGAGLTAGQSFLAEASSPDGG